MEDHALRDRVQRVEQALEQLEGLPAGPREVAFDAIAALVDLYGEGWSRTVRLLDASSPGQVAALARDDLIAHLLMIHDLHPDGLEHRVRAALDEVGASVGAAGRRLELVELTASMARVRLGSDTDRAEPVDGFRALVEQAVRAAAPELERVELDLPRPAPVAAALVQLGRVSRDGSASTSIGTAS